MYPSDKTFVRDCMLKSNIFYKDLHMTQKTIFFGMLAEEFFLKTIFNLHDIVVLFRTLINLEISKYGEFTYRIASYDCC